MKHCAPLLLLLLLLAPARAFAQQDPPAFQFTIKVSDGVHEKDLVVGMSPNATDGFDQGVDVEPPPPPPGQTFDARMEHSGKSYWVDIRESSLNGATFNLSYSPSGGNGPIVLSWDSAALPAAVQATLVDGLSGNFFSQDMKAVSSLDASTSCGGFACLADGLKIQISILGAPDAPSNLGAAAASETEIALSWTDNADDEDDLLIERSEDGGSSFSALATKPASSTAHADTGLNPNTQYCYRVAAQNAVGTSAYSNVACASTPAAILTFSPASLSFTLPEGGGSDQQTTTLNASAPTSSPVALSVAGGAPSWLTFPGSVQVGTPITVEVAAGALTPGSYTATVTAQSSDPAFSNAALVVSLQVAASVQTDWDGFLVVKNQQGASTTLEFGTSPDATDGEDPLFDRSVPPSPPSGVFDARLLNEPGDLFRDYRATNTTGSVVWTVELQPGTNGAPLQLDWSASSFPEEGRLTLSDAVGGVLIPGIDMGSQTSYTLTNPNVDKLLITYSLTSLFNLEVQSGWNLLALPLDPLADGYMQVFANVPPQQAPWYFSGSYQEASTMEPGLGYWTQFASGGTQPVEGYDVSSLTLELVAGWNLIGGPSCDLPVGSVTDEANILKPGSLYGFDKAYQASATIEQGQGYWIETSQKGQITLDCAAAAAKAGDTIARFDASAFDALTVRDAAGAAQTLYLGVKAEGSGLFFNLPPRPPAKSAFDARFDGDVRAVEAGSGLVQLQAAHFPLTIQVSSAAKETTYELQALANGKVVATHTLQAGETVQLDDAVTAMRVSKKGATNPGMRVFKMHGNFPNPFRYSTAIALDLPEPAHVEVAVVDLLGRTVLTYDEPEMTAGAQQVKLNASGLTSGLYLYRVTARMASQTITETGRMTLVK